MSHARSTSSVTKPLKAPPFYRPRLAPHRPREISTFADLLPVIDEMLDVPTLGRNVLRANLRLTAFLAAAAKARKEGRSIPVKRRADNSILPIIPADPVWLNEHLFAYPAELSGVTDDNRHLSVSGLRRIMRHVDLIDPYTTSTTLPQGSKWHVLLVALADVFGHAALASFATWCHSVGIEPEDVCQRTLDDFETFMTTRTLHSEIPRLVRTVCKGWKKAKKLLQAGPSNPLKAPSRRETYTLPFSDFPPFLQADVAAFRQRVAKEHRKSPFRGDAPRRPLQPSTVKGRLYCLRQACSALVLRGRDPRTITSLADLVEDDAFKTILLFFWERAFAARTTPETRDDADPALGVTTQTEAIAATLMMVAKYHCKLEAAAIQRLRLMAQDMTPAPQTQLSPKHRERLRQFDDPVTRAKLLHLPRHLRRQAEGKGVRPFEAALLARVAVAVELLLHVPLRNANLTHLRIGVHLRYQGSRIQQLVLQAHETKNRYDGEWPVGPELAEMLDWYITRFRPMLAPDGSDWLFPAGFGKEGPLSEVAMSQHIVRVVAEEVGAVVNPHLFRCLCARFILERSPEALEDVRLMIGDKSLTVVLAHYGASQPAHAARRTDKLLRDLRHESAPLVADLAKPRRSKGP